MSDFIQALLNYRFMQLAMVACVLASIGCGVMGAFVVVKRVGFLAGGIAHTVLAGMGIAYFFGAAPMTGATVAALVAAILIAWIRLRWQQEEDILIAAFWSVGMAIGVLFLAKAPGYRIDLMGYLFGDILLVSGGDLRGMFLLDVMLVLMVFVMYKQFLATSFDEEFAKIRGISVDLVYTTLLCLIALTVVLLIQIVGLILVIALLVLPAAAAAQFVTTLARMMLLAVVASLLVTTGGLAISYGPDLPSGACMIVLAGLVYVLALVLNSARRPGRTDLLRLGRR